MDYRIEHDSMGEVKVPADKLWGAQTQRSFQNFEIGDEKIPAEVITAFSYLKEAAALANFRLGVLDEKKAKLISAVCEEIRAGKLCGNFPLAVWQTGSGTPVQHERERGHCKPRKRNCGGKAAAPER